MAPHLHGAEQLPLWAGAQAGSGNSPAQRPPHPWPQWHHALPRADPGAYISHASQGVHSGGTHPLPTPPG